MENSQRQVLQVSVYFTRKVDWPAETGVHPTLLTYLQYLLEMKSIPCHNTFLLPFS
ncbi:hypothetical protein SHT67_14355 (plasmid) [Enterococcus faecalis]|uniref:hypothetical protein n=1 Tax=Enterococcus faecalis TaxID=1351 RepID=UPI0029C9804A|nr:hypothetical protein [Enterococcus faecalis]WPH48357.1 hypothetical protein SHT67_14355 [Enterococcus faecalis]